MPFQPAAQIGGLFRQHFDGLLLSRVLRLQGGQALAQVEQVLLGVGDALVERGDPLPQLAQFALARQDAALAVVRADGEGAVRLQ